MLSFGRLVGTFIAMMVAGYLAIVAFVPAPSGSVDRADDGGQSAAMRLSAEAQALVARKPAGALQ